jgi:hypothetical protein
MGDVVGCLLWKWRQHVPLGYCYHWCNPEDHSLHLCAKKTPDFIKAMCTLILCNFIFVESVIPSHWKCRSSPPAWLWIAANVLLFVSTIFTVILIIFIISIFDFGILFNDQRNSNWCNALLIICELWYGDKNCHFE